MAESDRKHILSSLPSEIKDSIYKLAVADACLHIGITPRDKTRAEVNAIPSSGWCGPTMSRKQSHELEVGHIKVYASTTLVALLLTCRQISQEMRPLRTAATEKLVIHCASIEGEAGSGSVGGFSGGVTFRKVSKAIFTPPQKLPLTIKRFLTLHKVARNHKALLARIQNVKTVVLEHWDPWLNRSMLARYKDPKLLIHQVVEFTAYCDIFWEWISSHRNVQSVVVRLMTRESDKEERKAVFKTLMEVAWDLRRSIEISRY